MERREHTDPIDRIILHRLSLYESLDLVELWYELGEDDSLRKERMTEGEISSRLESLRDQGLIEQKMQANGDIRWALKRGDIVDDPKNL